MAVDLSYYTDLLLKWYSANKRSLPWRLTKDPYRIWLSEVILQQTRVAQGLPYFQKFLGRFPTLKELANADIREVLLVWQGLGYYTRAGNLHKCAKIILNKYNGIFPGSYDELLKLPGIGPYTAAAIASISFNEKVPVLDGNVYRVLSRLFDIPLSIHSKRGIKNFNSVAKALITNDNPGDFNQAVMEFGALQCVPINPACNTCDLHSVCLSFSRKNQHERPVKQKKLPKKVRYFDYLVLESEKGLYLKKRSEKDIWQGLYEFYLLESKSRIPDLQAILKTHGLFRNVDLNCQYIRKYKHILTHQVIQATFYHIWLGNYDFSAQPEFDDGRIYHLDEIDNLPKPVLIDNYLKEEIF